MHGHEYRVEVEVAAADLDARGFAGVDYRELDPFKAWLDAHFDHAALLRHDDPLASDAAVGPRFLLPFNPTAEHLARFLFDVLDGDLGVAGVAAVRVSETAKTWAEFRPGAPA